jgi:hypothetical protein
MPGNKKRDLVVINVRIRGDQKQKIEKIKSEDFAATQDSIVRDSLDQYFEKRDGK